MVLLNRKDQKIKHNSISTEQLDEESVHKAEGEAVDQIRHQFRNHKEKKKKFTFSALYQTQTSTRHKSVGSQALLVLVFIELLVFLGSKFLFLFFSRIKEEEKRHYSKHSKGMDISGYTAGK